MLKRNLPAISIWAVMTEKLGERVDLHNSKFDIDEECLFKGIELQLNNIIKICEKYKQEVDR